MDNNIKIEGDSIVLSINPKLYALETIYSAAYVFLDMAYVLLDGDPETEILVKLRPKKEEDLKKLAGEFLNELINYGDYQNRAAETKEIREMLLQRSIITNYPPVINAADGFNEMSEEIDDDDFLDDPEGIAIPWEEKYGDAAKNKETCKENETKTQP